MRNTPLVSIIVPIYNLEKYISDCVNSLISQTYTNIEIILINDGSSDNSKSICEEFCKLDKRIRLLNHNSNLGVVSSRNTGIKASNGQYIIFVDGDDWLESNMVECFINNTCDTDLVTCGFFKEYDENNYSKVYNKNVLGIKSINDVLINSISASAEGERIISNFVWGKLFRTELVKKMFESMDTTITFAEDFVFLYKYLLLCKNVNFISECLYHYRIRQGSAANSRNKQGLATLNKIYIALEKDFNSHPLKDILVPQLQKWITHRLKWAINDGMGFTERFSSYVINTNGLDDKKIVLFGAGDVGKDAFYQLSRFGYELVLWIDNIKKECSNQVVFAPSELLNVDFDVVYIAVNNGVVAQEMKNQLIDMGIEENKIVWKAPLRIL